MQNGDAACSDAEANATKLQLEEDYRLDQGLKGACARFLATVSLESC